MFKWIALLLGTLLVAAILVLLIVTWIESRQASELAAKQPYTPATAKASRTAVVYFSRSGNTALAARHIALRLNAQLFPLEALAYQLGLGGLTNALKDANALKNEPEALREITSRTVDLTAFDTVWLGSPVWLYSPAPPIWAFVERHRFDGKQVVLFNTFNSHFGDEHIARLREKVMSRGARFFEHRHVLRGRMTQQLTADEMLRAMDEAWFAGAPATPPGSR